MPPNAEQYRSLRRSSTSALPHYSQTCFADLFLKFMMSCDNPMLQAPAPAAACQCHKLGAQLRSEREKSKVAIGRLQAEVAQLQQDALSKLGESQAEVARLQQVARSDAHAIASLRHQLGRSQAEASRFSRAAACPWCMLPAGLLALSMHDARRSQERTSWIFPRKTGYRRALWHAST